MMEINKIILPIKDNHLQNMTKCQLSYNIKVFILQCINNKEEENLIKVV